MSLLMDALRKAERARAARQEGESDEPQGEAPLALDPLESPDEGNTVDPLAAALPEMAPALEDEVSPLTRDTAAIGSEQNDAEELGFAEETLPPVENASASSRPRPLDETGARALGEVDDATAATLPSLKAARDSVNRYFDDTTASSASLSMEHVLPTDGETTTTGQRQAFEREASQQNARVVLAAKSVRRASTGGRWALFLGLPLILVLAAAGGYLFWLTEGGGRTWSGGVAYGAAPARSPGPASGVRAGVRDAGARDRAESTARSPRLGSASVRDNASGANTRAVAATPAASIAASGRRAEVAAPSSGDLTPTRAAPVPVPAAPAPQGPPVLTDAQFERVLRETSPLPKGFAAESGIRVRRGSPSGPSHGVLTRAYGHYTAGNLTAARAEYESALTRRPQSRDALLGLGAIAMRTGDLRAAQGHYASVLARHPRDPVAQAALIDLLTDLDPVAAETQLKMLLTRDPSAAYLNFSLGNLYASQARWPEAQAAYFQAYRADASNPDYAFNLAVSLDQLGQAPAARQYYQNALALSDTRAAGFESSDALARVRAIAP